MGEWFVIIDEDGKKIWRQPDGLPFGTPVERFAMLVRDMCAPGLTVAQLKITANPLTRAPYWSQRDPRWSGEKFGDRPTTIGQDGASLVCLAMGLTAVTGKEVTPLDVNAALKAVGGFFSCVNLHRVDWEKVPEAYPEFKLETGIATIAEIAEAVDRGDIVLAKVDFEMVEASPAHWLLLTGVDGQRPIFDARDPWPFPRDQQAITVPPAYCKQGWDADRAIDCVARFTREGTDERG